MEGRQDTIHPADVCVRQGPGAPSRCVCQAGKGAGALSGLSGHSSIT